VTNDIIIEPPPIPKELSAEIGTAVDVAKAIVIKDDADRMKADNLMSAWAGLKKQAVSFCKPGIDSAKAHVKLLEAQRDKVVDPLDEAVATVKPKALEYDAERRRFVEQERAKAEAEARELAEKARKAQLAQLKAAGEKEAAKALKAAPIVVPKVTAPVEPLKTTSSTTVRWHAEVVDLMSLVKAVAAGKQPLAYIEAVIPALNKQAMSLKAELAIPGVKAVPVETLAVRAAGQDW